MTGLFGTTNDIHTTGVVWSISGVPSISVHLIEPQ
jgi:hypothetical protein